MSRNTKQTIVKFTSSLNQIRLILNIFSKIPVVIIRRFLILVYKIRKQKIIYNISITWKSQFNLH